MGIRKNNVKVKIITKNQMYILVFLSAKFILWNLNRNYFAWVAKTGFSGTYKEQVDEKMSVS